MVQLEAKVVTGVSKVVKTMETGLAQRLWQRTIRFKFALIKKYLLLGLDTSPGTGLTIDLFLDLFSSQLRCS